MKYFIIRLDNKVLIANYKDDLKWSLIKSIDLLKDPYSNFKNNLLKEHNVIIIRELISLSMSECDDFKDD